MTTTIPLLFTKPPLRSNDRRSPMAQHRAFQAAKDVAIVSIRAAKVQPITSPVDATLVYTPGTARRQDSDGIQPSLKAVLDALVTCGVLEDDSSAYVPRATCWITPPGTPAMWVELTEVAA